MPAVRQDAWTQEEDLLLSDIVLRHIREGSTQLRAFEEAGKRMNRTAAACGFRWNSYVRKQYASEIEAAKKERKERKQLVRDSGRAPAEEGRRQKRRCLMPSVSFSSLRKKAGTRTGSCPHPGAVQRNGKPNMRHCFKSILKKRKSMKSCKKNTVRFFPLWKKHGSWLNRIKAADIP